MFEDIKDFFKRFIKWFSSYKDKSEYNEEWDTKPTSRENFKNNRENDFKEVNKKKDTRDRNERKSSVKKTKSDSFNFKKIRAREWTNIHDKNMSNPQTKDEEERKKSKQKSNIPPSSSLPSKSSNTPSETPSPSVEVSLQSSNTPSKAPSQSSNTPSKAPLPSSNTPSETPSPSVEVPSQSIEASSQSQKEEEERKRKEEEEERKRKAEEERKRQEDEERKRQEEEERKRQEEEERKRQEEEERKRQEEEERKRQEEEERKKSKQKSNIPPSSPLPLPSSNTPSETPSPSVEVSLQSSNTPSKAPSQSVEVPSPSVEVLPRSASASIENIPTETKKCRIECDYNNQCYCIVLSDDRKKPLYLETTINNEKSGIKKVLIENFYMECNKPTSFISNLVYFYGADVQVDFYIETVDDNGKPYYVNVIPDEQDAIFGSRSYSFSESNIIEKIGTKEQEEERKGNKKKSNIPPSSPSPSPSSNTPSETPSPSVEVSLQSSNTPSKAPSQSSNTPSEVPLPSSNTPIEIPSPSSKAPSQSVEVLSPSSEAPQQKDTEQLSKFDEELAESLRQIGYTPMSLEEGTDILKGCLIHKNKKTGKITVILPASYDKETSSDRAFQIKGLKSYRDSQVTFVVPYYQDNQWNVTVMNQSGNFLDGLERTKFRPNSSGSPNDCSLFIANYTTDDCFDDFLLAGVKQSQIVFDETEGVYRITLPDNRSGLLYAGIPTTGGTKEQIRDLTETELEVGDGRFFKPREGSNINGQTHFYMYYVTEDNPEGCYALLKPLTERDVRGEKTGWYSFPELSVIKAIEDKEQEEAEEAEKELAEEEERKRQEEEAEKKRLAEEEAEKKRQEEEQTGTFIYKGEEGSERLRYAIGGKTYRVFGIKKTGNEPTKYCDISATLSDNSSQNSINVTTEDCQGLVFVEEGGDGVARVNGREIEDGTTFESCYGLGKMKFLRRFFREDRKKASEQLKEIKAEVTATATATFSHRTNTKFGFVIIQQMADVCGNPLNISGPTLGELKKGSEVSLSSDEVSIQIVQSVPQSLMETTPSSQPANTPSDTPSPSSEVLSLPIEMSRPPFEIPLPIEMSLQPIEMPSQSVEALSKSSDTPSEVLSQSSNTPSNSVSVGTSVEVSSQSSEAPSQSKRNPLAGVKADLSEEIPPILPPVNHNTGKGIEK